MNLMLLLVALAAMLTGLFVWGIVAIFRGRHHRHNDRGAKDKPTSTAKSPSPSTAPDSYNLGLKFLEAGDLDAAEQSFRDSLAEGNFIKSSALRLADIAQRRHDPELAAELRKRATTLKDLPSTTNAPDSEHALEGLIERSELETAKRTVRLISECTMDVRPHSSATLSLTCKAGFFFTISVIIFLARMTAPVTLPAAIGFAALVICFLAGIRYLYKAWVINTSRYEMRDGLILLHRGGFSRHTFIMEIFRISNVSIHRSFINRLTSDGALYIVPDKADGYFNFDLLGVAKCDQLPDLQLKLRELNRLLRVDPRIKGIIR